jgi:hypothetical protein
MRGLKKIDLYHIKCKDIRGPSDDSYAVLDTTNLAKQFLCIEALNILGVMPLRCNKYITEVRTSLDEPRPKTPACCSFMKSQKVRGRRSLTANLPRTKRKRIAGRSKAMFPIGCRECNDYVDNTDFPL